MMPHKCCKGLKDFAGVIKRKSFPLATALIIVLLMFNGYRHFIELRHRADGVDATRTGQNKDVQEWLLKRKAASARSSSKKVLLFAYMRGGSTILSQAFSTNPDVFFWYEPLDQFYSNILGSYYHLPVSHALFLQTYTLRPIHQWESDLLAEYIHNMYTCQLDRLPIETLTHFKTYWDSTFDPLKMCLKEQDVKDIISGDCKLAISHCYGNVNISLRNNCTTYIQHYNKGFDLQWTDLPIGDTQTIWDSGDFWRGKFEKHAACLAGFKKSVAPCLPTITSACNKKPIQASKMLKLTMDSVDEVLERVPDLSLVFFVRDPRGTATSRKGSGITFSESNDDVVAESLIICQKMRNDLHFYRTLQHRYPGAILLVRYEDLVLDLRQTLNDIYTLLNEPFPQLIYETLYEMMNADKKARDDNMFGVHRSDARKSLYKWLAQNSEDEIHGMSKHCSDVLEALGYPYTVVTGDDYVLKPPLVAG